MPELGDLGTEARLARTQRALELAERRLRAWLVFGIPGGLLAGILLGGVTCL